MGEESAKNETEEGDGDADGQGGLAERPPQDLAAVGDAAHVKFRAVGHFRAGQDEIFFGVFRAAVDFELMRNLLDIGLHDEAAPAVGNELDVDANLGESGD
jgi:hypothetical protein